MAQLNKTAEQINQIIDALTGDVSNNITVGGSVTASGYTAGVATGVDGTFTSNDGKTITVTKGIITSIV